MNFNIKNRIRQNLKAFRSEADKLQDEIDENSQIEILEYISALDKWLKNDTPHNLIDFFYTANYCMECLTQKMNRSYWELVRLIFKTRCNFIIFMIEKKFKIFVNKFKTEGKNENSI